MAEWRMKMASARLRLAAPARRRSVRSARRRRRGRARTAARGSRAPRGSSAAPAPSWSARRWVHDAMPQVVRRGALRAGRTAFRRVAPARPSAPAACGGPQRRAEGPRSRMRVSSALSSDHRDRARGCAEYAEYRRFPGCVFAGQAVAPHTCREPARSRRVQSPIIT